MEIKITNWDKFNPKRDQKTYTWLRLDNDFPFSMESFGLTAHQKLIWISVLCLASKKNKSTVFIDLGFLSTSLSVAISEVETAFELFEQNQWIEIPATAHDRARPRTTAALHFATPTNVRTNVSILSPAVTTDINEFNLDDAYKLYPKRKGSSGKGKGMEILRRKIKTKEDYEKLVLCIKNYSEMERENHGTKFIKQFSTFAGCYLDHESEQAPKSKITWFEDEDKK